MTIADIAFPKVNRKICRKQLDRSDLFDALVAKQLRRAEKTIRKMADAIKTLKTERDVARIIAEPHGLTPLGQLKRAEAILHITSDAILHEERGRALRNILSQIKGDTSPSMPPAAEEAADA